MLLNVAQRKPHSGGIEVGKGGCYGSVFFSPALGGFGSARTTTTLNFATSAEIAPTAARTGASTVPITATVTGISMNVFPCSSLTMIRCTFPSLMRDFTLLDLPPFLTQPVSLSEIDRTFTVDNVGLLLRLILE